MSNGPRRKKPNTGAIGQAVAAARADRGGRHDPRPTSTGTRKVTSSR